MSSFFHQITRYRITDGPNQSENRLTEVFAAVLERVPELAQRLASQWLGSEISGELLVQTQRPTKRGGFVDAELAFSQDGRPPVVIWIENKHGAGLSGDEQLDRYVADLADLDCDAKSRVVLLAPEGSMPPIDAALRDSVVPRYWHEVARTVRDFAREDVLTDVQRWLVRELYRYLRGEKNLTDTDPLRAEHALALTYMPQTRLQMNRLAELVDKRLGERFAAEGSSGGQVLGGWRTYGLTSAGVQMPPELASAWLEWGCREDTKYVEEPRGGWVFTAGGTWHAADGPSSGWTASLAEAGGFRSFKDGKWWRVWRFLYPDQLLNKGTLAAQAAELADWVSASFDQLAGVASNESR